MTTNRNRIVLSDVVGSMSTQIAPRAVAEQRMEIMLSTMKTITEMLTGVHDSTKDETLKPGLLAASKAVHDLGAALLMSALLTMDVEDLGHPDPLGFVKYILHKAGLKRQEEEV